MNAFQPKILICLNIDRCLANNEVDPAPCGKENKKETPKPRVPITQNVLVNKTNSFDVKPLETIKHPYNEHDTPSTPPGLPLPRRELKTHVEKI